MKKDLLQRALPLVLSLALLTPVDAFAQAAQAGEGRWLSAWTVSHNARQTPPALDDSTVRMIVRPTVSGNAVRVKLENTLGRTPVTFSAAFLGVTGQGASVIQGSNTQLSFGGHPAVTLSPGAGAWSDPIIFAVTAFENLTVSLDVASVSDVSGHTLGLVTNYRAQGAHAADPSGTGFDALPPGGNNPGYPFYWLAAVDVMSSASGTIVAFGDSITDGRCSTNENNVVVPDRHQRWTDVLAARLASLPAGAIKAVVNEGIAGNRIAPSGGNGPAGLVRLDRDVLDRAGATHVILFEGTNDIRGGATAEEVIAGTQQVINRVHAKGLAIIGVTIIPRGRPDSVMGWDPNMEQHRLAVNTWIRSEATFDGVIDFDSLMKGGPVFAGSQSLKPEFDCGDYTHPNPAGYKAMGEAIDLGLFGAAR
jgi:lysophospholipase L1-like esterase